LLESCYTETRIVETTFEYKVPQAAFQLSILPNTGICWKDSYNPVVVAGHVDRPECWLFRPALLRGFGPDCRTVTLVNTSTVTIIPATVFSF
jgi:hypothetical protein